MWDLPNLALRQRRHEGGRTIVNDWQLSGILTAGSAPRYDVTYAYQNGGTSVNLTGSPSYPAMIRFVGDTGQRLLG